MRLFQVKIKEPHDYGWTLDHAEYHDRYAKEREQQAIVEAKYEAMLKAIGITVIEKAPTVITESQLTALVVGTVEFELVRELPLDDDDPSDLNGVMRKFNRMAAKLMSLPGLQRNGTHHDCQNQRVEVHMPGQALSTYNEVLLQENCCSDELQGALDQGWRIIAACPQPDARRPDYILGRYNPEYGICRNDAKRHPE